MENEQEDKSENETLDFTKPDFTFTPQGTHIWRQSGYYLVCKSCDIEHAVYIGANKIMVGLQEDGSPILKTRRELGMA
jgi:hypothetical protein